MKRMKFNLFILLCIILEMAHSQPAPDTSCGIVWYPTVQISPDTLERAQGGIIAVQGDTVHISWNWSSNLRFPYLRSVDGGKTFEELRDILPDSLTDLYKRFLITNGGYLYGGFIVAYGPIPQSDKCFLIVSSDRGTTWSELINYPDSTHYVTYTVCNDTLVFVNTHKRYSWHIAATTDKGKTWITKPYYVIGSYHDLAMTPGVVHFVKGWVFDSSGHQAEYVIQYRKSTDLGLTWSDSINVSTIFSRGAWDPQIGASKPGDSPKIAIIWIDSKYGCLTMTGCSVMERHLDLKDSVWSNEKVLTPEPRGTRDDIAIDKSIIAATWTSETIINYASHFNLHINISLDGGRTWCPPYNLTPTSNYAGGGKIAISKSKIHVVWDEYIGEPNIGKWKVFYRRGEILPLSVENKNKIPTTFELHQNYPNPFNTGTKLSFIIGHESFVSIKVYDVFGREVATLVNEKKQPGEYEVEWNPSTPFGLAHDGISRQVLASGVYFIRMVAGQYISTIKAILMK